MRLVIFASTLTLLAGPALAQSLNSPKFYGSAGYTWFDGDDATLGAITVRAGAKLHRYAGAEIEGSLGVDDDSFSASVGGPGKYELKHDVAAYAVGFLPVTEKIDLFARLGYGTTEIKANVPGVKSRQDGDSVNYGLGASYFIDRANGLRADWTRRDFTGSHSGTVDTWAIAYVRRF
jgi:hypothetical protein